MKSPLLSTIFSLLWAFLAVAHAVPQLISYQGRIDVDGVNFTGTGQFKFALVNEAGDQTFWSNDGTSTGGSEPTNGSNLSVSKGLYTVLLGDATIPNMTAIPSSVFNNDEVYLRIWFNDGSHGWQVISPDRRIAAVGYALMSDSVPDGAITSSKIANGAIGSTKLGSNLTLGGTTTGTFSGELTGNVIGNVAASQLQTMGAEVTVSDAPQPVAGQVLTANGATSASWQTPPTPKVDRQSATPRNANSRSDTYVDLISLTTQGLGEPGCYTICFHAEADANNHGGMYFILNVNGTDVSQTEQYVNGDAQFPSIIYVANNVPAGSLIKVRYRNRYSGNANYVNRSQLMIDGVPQSYVQ